MTEPAPQLDLSFPRVAVCDRHGEPFRKEWPKGYAQMVIFTLELIQSDEGLANEAGSDPTAIGALLMARPVCERVPIERIRALYMAAEIAVDGICARCGRRAPGTEYQRTEVRRLAGLTRRRVVTDNHLCFDCVLTGLTPA